jgi:DNA-binding LytR/AlgR family response regulator
MNARTARFWWFQAIFWIIAGTTLFISGATQMPLIQAFVRNAFLLFAGFLSSFFLAMVIDELRWMKMLRLRITSYVLAYVVALFCVVVINAISYTLRGTALEDLRFGQWFGGAMNLGLIYAFWSELFIQQIYFDERREESKAPAIDKVVVEHQGSLVSLPLADIGSITAAGDYVEIHAGDKSYLDRHTLHSLEASLGNEMFLRVHRSKLVNRQHVEAVTPLSKGRYQLQLRDGSTIDSSRGYQEVVRKNLLASAV